MKVRALLSCAVLTPVLACSGGDGGAGPTSPGDDHVFSPTADTQISGALSFDRVSIPAGVTVTVTGDLTITVSGPVEIAGRLSGDCVTIEIDGSTAVTVTGVVSNACAALPAGDPPPLTLAAADAFLLDGARIESSGDIDIHNGGAASAALSPAQAGTRGVRIERGASIGHVPRKAAASRRGSTIRVVAGGGDLVIDAGSEIVAQDGGDGESEFSQGASFVVVASGGDGEDGGDVFLSSLTGALFFTRESGGPNRVRSGDGGDGGGGDAIGLTREDGPSNAEAFGGDGGDPGTVTLEAYEAVEIVEGAVEFVVGNGGDGGDAAAIGSDGRGASSDRAAQSGGAAASVAGSGGSGGFLVSRLKIQGTTDDVPDAPTLDMIPVAGGDGGSGGNASAAAGGGGKGFCGEYRDGAGGGVAVAWGGDGGDGLYRDVTPIGSGGSGGSARFAGGAGGVGASCCEGTPTPGGNGGNGGDAGLGEDFDYPSRVMGGGKGGKGVVTAPHGESLFDRYGNGGDGGSGTTRGLAGNAGPSHHPLIEKVRIVDPSFEPGADGGKCPPSRTALIDGSPYRADVVLGMVNGHCGFEGEWDGIQVVDGGGSDIVIHHSLFGETLTWDFTYDPVTGVATPPDGSSVKDAVTFANGVTLEVELGACHAEDTATSEALAPAGGSKRLSPAQDICSATEGKYTITSVPFYGGRIIQIDCEIRAVSERGF